MQWLSSFSLLGNFQSLLQSHRLLLVTSVVWETLVGHRYLDIFPFLLKFSVLCNRIIKYSLMVSRLFCCNDPPPSSGCVLSLFYFTLAKGLQPLFIFLKTQLCLC